MLISVGRGSLICKLSPNPSFHTTQNIILKPVIKDNSIIHLDSDELFVLQDEIYGIKENCKTLLNIKTCNHEIFDLSNSDCIPKLSKSQKSRL